jgi:uncharacterized protein
MQLSLDVGLPGNHVRSVGDRRIVLTSGEFTRSFVMGVNHAPFEWPVPDLKQLTAKTCEPIIALQPNVVILGCGNTQRFPDQSVMAAFLTRGIGIEVMSNAAAARTYNVLLDEGRNVVAAFILGSNE